jgi:hypothetical protein
MALDYTRSSKAQAVPNSRLPPDGRLTPTPTRSNPTIQNLGLEIMGDTAVRVAFAVRNLLGK